VATVSLGLNSLPQLFLAVPDLTLKDEEWCQLQDELDTAWRNDAIEVKRPGDPHHPEVVTIYINHDDNHAESILGCPGMVL
jgi:hypothetical protein